MKRFHLLVVVTLVQWMGLALAQMSLAAETHRLATFAGGCFWCIQPPFDKKIGEGVIKTEVGFSGGEEKNTSYYEVASGKTSHTESVQVTYDPAKISYQQLLDIFWDNIDPTDLQGQFNDRGSQYRPAIFVHDDEQKKIAQQSKNELEKSKRFSKPIVVPIEDYKFFIKVSGKDEEVHDKYYQKKPLQYELYKKGSGRKKFIETHQKKK